jgi:peptidoglycan-associated lipoprotein
MRSEFNAKITALEDGIKFDIPVNFAYDDATVRDQDKAALDRFAAITSKYYGGSKVTIEGFADPAGSKQYNLALSQRRADAVRDYLSGKGLDMSVLKTIGYGKTRLVNPSASKDDPGAEQNRRVTFVIETAPGSGSPTASAEGAATAGQQ